MENLIVIEILDFFLRSLVAVVRDAFLLTFSSCGTSISADTRSNPQNMTRLPGLGYPRACLVRVFDIISAASAFSFLQDSKLTA